LNPLALAPFPFVRPEAARRLGVLLVATVVALVLVAVAATAPGPASTQDPVAAPSATGHASGAPKVPAGLRSAIAATHGGAGLSESFADDGGLHVHEAGDTSANWSLVPVSLVRSGRAGALDGGRVGAALHGSAPTVVTGTTTYALGPLSAWYRSGAAGVEQGFTIATRPAGPGPSLSISLRSSGTLTPELAGGSLTLRDRSGTPVLRYGSLRVTDATGRVLPARLAVSPGTVRIVVRDAGAVYPLHVDPYTQQATLVASDGTFNDYFGESVAISGDGLTAVVGADNKTVDGLQVAGESYVYVDQGGTWSQQQALLPTPVSTDAFFGNSMALSADGNTAFIAAFGLKVGANFSQGGVYVFTRSGTTWTQRTLITASNGVQCDDLGSSVAVNAAGTELLVGAKGLGGCANHVGAAYVFSGSGATWTQGAELTSGSSTAEEFGSAVALSSDGSTALVGAPFALGGQGAAYLFTGTGLATRVTISDPHTSTSDAFGTAVALSADGSVAVVTSPYAEITPYGGAAYVYSGPGHGTTTRLVTPLASGLGISAAISADGTIVVLGNYYSSTVGSFEFSGPGYSTVSPIDNTTSGAGIGPYLGYALAMTPDGTTFVTAGPGITVGTNVDQGEAAIFHTTTPSTPQTLGYWLAAANGAVKAFGQAVSYGSEAGAHLAAPIVGLTGTSDGKGYWLVGADGGVFAFGDAAFHGSLAGTHLNSPIVGMAATPSGGGYWLVASDGGVFAYGNAGFHGSLGGVHLNAPIVGVAATADGGGYWMVGADGGVFAYGDAGFHGALVGTALSGPIVGIARTADSGGYWLDGSDGAVYGKGDAVLHGSLVGTHLNRPIDDIVPTADGGGYALVAGDGGLFSFGDAPFYGSGVGAFPGTTVVGLAASNQT
jgi:hypothetical protein